jgi:hypothetical protein
LAGATLALLLAPWNDGVGRAEPIDEVPQGTMLSKDNWEIAKGHLPDEILEFYKRGDYSNPIMHLNVTGKSVVDPRFEEISAQNDGKFDIDANGTVIDKATGQRPKVITGRPFPKIDPNDPKAGQKAIWNWFYTLYWEGSFHTQSPVNWVSREGPLRRIATDVYFKYYDGNPPEFQEKIGDNPLNILSRTIGVVREPADVNGVVSLNWRYRDGDKEDNAWSYVPALRRVRPVNPQNRSDGLLGSDISQDDGPYFDAKPEDFNYKLIGEGKILAHFDKTALESGSPLQRIQPGEEVAELIPSSNSGWKLTVPDLPAIAAQTPNWKPGEGLVAWAPAQIALVPRPVWIVEATPKNQYYLYGKQVMYFDKESFRGYWKNKYDWKNNALSNWAPPAMPVFKVDGPPGYMRTGGGGNVAYAVNYKLDRATVTGMPIAPTQYYVDIDDKIYEVDRMIRSGK